jgi:hypothetical protein
MTPARDAAVRRDAEDVTPNAVYDRPRLTVVESPKSGVESPKSALPPRTSDRIRRVVRTVAAFFAVGPSPT